MQSTLSTADRASQYTRPSSFGLIAGLFVLISAAIASFAPIAFSIATVFLFAGPHNWVELRYFLSRLPSRFGPLKAFFLSSFFGVFALGASYSSLIWLMHEQKISYENSIFSFKLWIIGFFVWLGTLICSRRVQGKISIKAKTLVPMLTLVSVSLCLSLSEPLWFGLLLVYLHPFVGLCILDRELRRSKPHWLMNYRGLLACVPFVIVMMLGGLYSTPSLATKNLLNEQISEHAGSFLMPQLSTHMLVSVHTFLEMLHYGVWLLAIPLASAAIERRKWVPQNMPVARESKKLQFAFATAFIISNLLVFGLWGGFIADYAATRELYFTVAVFHILAEIPFLMWLL